MIKILVVEDDKELNSTVCKYLELNGFTAVGCLNAQDAYNEMYGQNFDMIISDIMMPKTDGFEFAETVRSLNKEIPIIFMTAKDDMNSKQRGYRLGIDDYLVKPIEIEELKARVLALLNRSGKGISSLRVKEVLSKGDITLIPESYSVQILDKQTSLTPIEFDILNVLMQHEGSMVNAKTLLKEVWGYEDDNDIDTIRVHITHLRAKIDKISSQKNKYIKTIYGGGYRLLADGVEKK